jgi:hypothetical protein
MTLSELTIAAVLAFARGPAVDPVAERPRLESFGRAIASAVHDRQALLEWLPGSMAPLPSTPERTSLALVAIAFHESSFRAEVSDCRIVGFAEPSITAFQLNGRWAWGPYTKRQLCRSPRLAAERALYVLSAQAQRCGSLERAFMGYASGNCARNTKAGRELVALWKRALERAR